ELRFFGDSVQHNVNVLLSGNVRPAVAGPRRPAALPVLGPATAGPITHVELRPLDGCRAGAVCNVLVQVTVKPQDRPLEVAWSLELFDRCRPGRDPGPGGVMTIAPGRDRAVQTAAVPLPPVQALAVIPLTSSPAAVAGAPMRLSADDGPC
ncbi:MAG TPA: hypothetical protein VGR20_18485, partial [Acidimicrobiia bacterium]|nr:hypothetical protein [Acidimicrobiia bacterium]